MRARERSWIAAAMLCAAAAVLVVGCGGGGGGGGGSDAPATAIQTSTPVAKAIVAAAQNVLPIAVESTATGWLNGAYASVTVCAPGSSTECQQIDHVLVDTGSTGLRIMASALASPLNLVQQVDAAFEPIAECAQFASGFTWGSVKLADVKLAGEEAHSLPIQIIGDPDFLTIPSACAATGSGRNTVESFAVNGILGVGVFRQDCGSVCEFSASAGIYYACPGSACRAVALPATDQVQNPVTMLGADNNGVMISLPSVGESGAAGVSGALVFGIGTQANNRLGSASVLGLDPLSGELTTVFESRAVAGSIVDSGSNAIFFPDAGMATCSGAAATNGFYCPSATQHLSATLQGANGTSAKVDFSVANADALIVANASRNAALSNLGGPTAAFLGFDWGLPFFYGRSVFVAVNGATTPGGDGPYVAF